MVFLLSGFFAYRMFLLLLRIIFDFTIFPTLIHRIFLHRIFLLIGCFCLIFASFLPFFDNFFCLFPKKFRNFFSAFSSYFYSLLAVHFVLLSLSISWIALLLPLYPSRSALVSKRNFGMTCYSSLFLVVLSAL